MEKETLREIVEYQKKIVDLLINLTKSKEGEMVKKKNPWTEHVSKVKKANPKMKFSDVLKKAKQSYKK